MKDLGKLIRSKEFWLSKETWLVIIVSVMLFYQLLWTQVFLWPHHNHRIIHLGFCLVIALLSMASSRRNRFLVYLLIPIVIGITVQLILILPEVMGTMTYPPTIAMVCSVIALILCLVLTWRQFGILFPVFFVVALVYIFFGPYFLPAAIRPPGVATLRVIGWIASDVFQEWGIYGSLLSLFANYIWLYIVFGSVLQAFGGFRFIRHIGNLVASRLSSGPAALSVVTSALLGSCTGSTAANVAITGSFTIPLMKEKGYTREQAGAIEVAASNGGQILPPIMGATAFILADFLGMRYIKVCLFALIPALLYFATIFLYVQLQAKKAHLSPIPGAVNRRELLLDAPLFCLPFLTLILLLVQGYSLMFVGFWAVVVAMALAIISSLLRREARIDWREAKEVMVKGVKSACNVSILIGVLGAIAAIVEMSGLGTKLGYFMLELSGGNLLVMLFLTATVCLILGTGIPTPAVYVIVASMLAPHIMALGVSAIAAHLFVFVFGTFAHFTPPIGVGLILANKLAGGNYWGTAREALKAGFIIFFLPFFFVYTPAIILQLEGISAVGIITQFVLVIVFIPSLSILFSNYCFTGLSLPEKGLLAIGGAFPLLAVIFPAQAWLLVMIGAISCTGGLWLNLRRSRTVSTL